MRQNGRKGDATRPLIANNITYRPATIQHIRIGTGRDSCITAIAHESWSGNLAGGTPKIAVRQTEMLYAGHRHSGLRLANRDLPEDDAMRASGETSGLIALEIAIDEMAKR